MSTEFPPLETDLAEARIAPIPAPSWTNVIDSRAPLPPVYRWLKEQPAGSVTAELPARLASDYSRPAFHDSIYMVWSTSHWQPLVNGYSGFQPLSFHASSDALYAFPDGPWLEFLRARGVTHLFVHQSVYPPPIISQLDATPELDRVVSQDGVVLYRLRPAR